ncbi:metalloendopeptidase OMA1, mitochondrial-like isoform X2 [Ornithodoros turicata]|uniref:metalloendopeptidase OMA1, mitochondrial-like isoform X2 n=1 Tax=Ornithodoros turicata TaxID=34597 RepID=UPI00313A2B5D
MLRIISGATRTACAGWMNRQSPYTCGILRSAERVAGFRTTPPRYIHPAFLLIAKQLTKGLAVLTGRGFRKWWRSLPQDRKAYFVAVAKRNRVKIAVTCSVFVAAGSIYYVSHIQETPITHRRRFVAFTTEQFRKISDFEFQMQYEMFKDHLLPSFHPAYARVTRVANQLLRGNHDVDRIHDMSWSVSVVKMPLQNAFVLPSGQIFVFQGMLDLCENNDQLGNVLAHEMAHCILGHGAEQVSYAHLLDLIIIVFLAAIWAVMPTDAIALFAHWFFHRVIDVLLHLPYSRKLELEADEVGLQLAAKALQIRRQCGCAEVPHKDPRTLLSALKKELELHKNNQLAGVVILQKPK